MHFAKENADGSLSVCEYGENPGNGFIEVTQFPGARPSKYHAKKLVGTVIEWVLPATLEGVKASKRAQINAWRQQANESSFTFAGKQIACDRLSRGDIDGVTSEVAVTQALPATFPGGWKAVDNTYVPIPDVVTWVLFVKAMVAQGSANFAHSQALKTQVDVAATMEEIDAIQW